MNRDEYASFTTTDCWKIRRDHYMRNRSTCEICSTKADRLQLHHLSYDNMGHEPDSDLIAVCEQCHKSIHGLGSEKWTRLMLATAKQYLSSKKRDKVISILQERVAA